MTKNSFGPQGIFLVVGLFLSVSVGSSAAKVRQLKGLLPLRAITIRTVAYNATGTCFAVPNFVSVGSIALFMVSPTGMIASVPSRLNEKNFSRAGGAFLLNKKKLDEPDMAFIQLPELLSGYAVDFSPQGQELAVAGDDKVWVFDGNNAWEQVRSFSIGGMVSRACFSPDNKQLGILADGKCFLFSTEHYALQSTIEPAPGCRFSDIAFMSNSTKCALYEYRDASLDYGVRVRVFFTTDGSLDRDLPYFAVKPSSEPIKHAQLLSYSPGDSLLAVTIPNAFAGKVFLVKANDGTVRRVFKGYCHAFSPDGTLFAAEGKVFATATWNVLGKYTRSALVCTFSPTDRTLVVVTSDALRRYRVEE